MLSAATIALTCWSLSASAITYSGMSLAGLTYTGSPASDSKFVSGPPAYAELFTADSNAGDVPAVSVNGPFGTLGSFSASYVRRSQTGGPATDSGYWAIWVRDPGNPLNKIQIIAYSGETMDSSTQVHGDTSNPAGIAFGTLLSAVDGMSFGSTTLGNWIVDSAGVEIGNFRDGNGTMDVTIASITLPGGPVPDVVATLPLLALCFCGLAALRRVPACAQWRSNMQDGLSRPA